MTELEEDGIVFTEEEIAAMEGLDAEPTEEQLTEALASLTNAPEVPTSNFEKPDLANVPCADIDMGPRARKDYKDLKSFWQDIQKRGLIHPIAILETPELKTKYLLLAGGRRFAAHLVNGAETIPARIYKPGLSKLEIKEIELMENLYRENLAYAEEVALKKEIHDLKVAQFGESKGSEAGHSISDTAKILKESVTNTSQDLELAKAIALNPRLAQQKNKTAAKQLLQRLKREVAREVSIKDFEKKVSNEGEDRIKKALIECYMLRDCREGMKDLPANSMHCIEIDPPYAIDLVNVRRNDTDRHALEEYNEITAAEYPEFMDSVLKEAARCLSPSGWLLLWFSMVPWYQMMLDLLAKHGLIAHGLPAIWFKPNISGQTNDPSKRLASVYEGFLYARKEDGVIFRPGRSNHFSYGGVNTERRIHPTERPIELLQDILLTFCAPSGNVLVPFAGSGNTLLAAVNLGLKPIGFDLSKTYKTGFASRVISGTLGHYAS